MIRGLKTFVAVAQAAVRAQMQRLDAHLGCALFDRIHAAYPA